ncbi:MAG: putative 2-aminoethylphosphonate ABC transporter substrate-binding protein, partial [Gammaproteobacteria bacterium]|nr:putative 2-aminoethylphosphonate ABC transporter substrate-binding protein [Gammaproteobacteria bacterium]
MKIPSVLGRIAKLVLAGTAGLAFSTSALLAATTLTVYTAIEADDLKAYAAEFNKQYPDIEIKWVRDS